MKHYEVTDNGKPAFEGAFPKLSGEGWTEYEFETFREAVSYARHWLGQWDVLPEGIESLTLEGSISVDYSGYGDILKIESKST